jgi:hypothetical protein
MVAFGSLLALSADLSIYEKQPPTPERPRHIKPHRRCIADRAINRAIAGYYYICRVVRPPPAPADRRSTVRRRRIKINHGARVVLVARDALPDSHRRARRDPQGGQTTFRSYRKPEKGAGDARLILSVWTRRPNGAPDDAPAAGRRPTAPRGRAYAPDACGHAPRGAARFKWRDHPQFRVNAIVPCSMCVDRIDSSSRAYRRADAQRFLSLPSRLQSDGRRPASERYAPRPHLVHSCIAEATYATFLLLRPAMEMRPSLVR